VRTVTILLGLNNIVADGDDCPKTVSSPVTTAYPRAVAERIAVIQLIG
jgi:hypothetical protein